jgi:hypothetical protein
MALSANNFLDQRFGDDFGGYVASGVHVYAGALCAWNAAGQVVRIQDSGAVAFAGIAAGERDNTNGTELRPLTLKKGCWAITVPGAVYANIGQPVYASDDNTVNLGSFGVTTAPKSGGNTGNGGFTAGPVTEPGVKLGAYIVTFSSATAYMVTDENGDSLWGGTAGVAYSGAALGFTLSAGTTAFVAGDAFTITVTQAAGTKIGVLEGIDNGQTYVKLA